jgi:trk system potassium uptake protein
MKDIAMPLSVMIIGGGNMGAYLCQLLLAGGHQAKIVEIRQERIPELRLDLLEEAVVWGNGTDPSVLEAAGINDVTVVAAVTGNDETNLVVTSLARFEFGISRTIARVNNPRNSWMFTSIMGVDVALNQAELMGHLIAEEMSLGQMMTLLKLRRGQYALVEEKVDATALASARSVHDLNLPSQCILVAVLREGQLLVPQPELVLQPEDEVLAVVHVSYAAELAALLGPQLGHE